MDIDEIAAEAASALAARLGANAADELTTLLGGRLSSSRAGANALAILRDNPDSSDAQALATGVLGDELARDPEFAAELARALGRPTTQISHVTLGGHSVVRGDVAGGNIDKSKRFRIGSVRFGGGGLTALILFVLASLVGAGYGVYKVVAPKAGPPPASPLPWSEVKSEAAWRLAEFVPASDVEAVDGGFVLYALDRDGRLMVIGVDASSGAVRWQLPANESWIVSGVGLGLAVHDGMAVYMSAPDAKSAAQGLVQVTAVDAVTGQLRWKHATAYTVSGQPRFCDDDRRVCLIGHAGGQARTVTLDAATGNQMSVAPAAGAREVSDQLTATDSGLVLVHSTVDGKQVWRKSTTEIFGSPVSADNGWNIRLGDGRYVGMLGSAWHDRSQKLEMRRTGGFDENTGAQLWSAPGTWVCSGIEFTLLMPVRCRGTGTISVDNDRTATLDGQITVEGFDPASGTATWSWSAGNVLGLVFPDDSVRRIDDKRYVIDTATGQIVLDVATGHHQVADDAVPTWCTDSEYVTIVGGNMRRNLKNLRISKHWPCRQDGDVSGLPTTIGDFAGARSGDVYAWVAPDGLRAAKIA